MNRVRRVDGEQSEVDEEGLSRGSVPISDRELGCGDVRSRLDVKSSKIAS